MLIGPANKFKASKTTNIELMDDLIIARQPSIIRIRNAFFRCYNYFNKQATSSYGLFHIPKWDGGTDRRNQSHTGIWIKVSRMLKNNKIGNLERFVYAQFAMRTSKKLFPTVLLSDQAVPLYIEFNETADEALQRSLVNENSTFKGLVSRVKTGDERSAWSAVLLDMTNDLSPLFRYVIASSEKLDDVIAVMYRPAGLQVMLDPVGYLNTWGRVEQIKGIILDLVGGQIDGYDDPSAG